MSSIDRPLSGKGLLFKLGEKERAGLIDRHLLEKAGRSARTLVKEGPLRATVVALAPGGEMAEHRSTGPITIHVLEGELSLRAGADEWRMEEGDLLSLSGGVPHDVRSEDGAMFLLTLVDPTPPDHGPRAA